MPKTKKTVSKTPVKKKAASKKTSIKERFKLKPQFPSFTDLKGSAFSWVVVAAVVVAVLRLLYIHFGPLDLAPDEAHYWEFSRTLDWSYYSKPPMVAWLIALSTAIFGDTLLGVRFFAVVGVGLLSIIGYLIVRDWKGEKAGVLAFILLTITPIFAAGSLLMTPDIPSLVFWALAIYMLERIYWNEPNKEISGRMRRFITLGVVVGLAGLSKYTTAMFFPLLAIYLIMDKERTVWLKKKEIYVAGLVALLVTSPVIFWNATSDWISFKHVFGQAGGESGTQAADTVGNFLSSQFAVIGPVTFLFLLWVWVMPYFKKQRTGLILWCFSAPIFFGFLIKSFDAKVQANWPVLALFTGLLLLAGWVVEQKRWVKITFGAGLVFSLLISAIMHDTFTARKVLAKVGIEVKIPLHKDPLKPVMGWKELGSIVSAMREHVGGEVVILTTRYQTASELAFYMDGQPEVLYINPGYRRQNQYDYWSWPGNLHEKTFMYVQEGVAPMEPAVQKGFGSCVKFGRVAAHREGHPIRTAQVFVCAGYKGLERVKPEKF